MEASSPRTELLSVLRDTPKELSLLELFARLDATTDAQQQQVLRALRSLERSGQVTFTKQKKYRFERSLQSVKGTVLGHRDGYGWLKTGAGEDDLYINAQQMRLLIHGDVVEGIIGQADRRGRVEFKFQRLLESRSESVVGRFYTENNEGFVIPDDNRIQHEILIPKEFQKEAKQGHVVVVEITQRPRPNMYTLGKIIEILGEHMAPGIEIQTAIRNFEIPHRWPSSVLRYVKRIPSEVPEEAKINRVDLRQLPLVTIDGEDARDFDDAVFCQPEADGFRLWVAIADVSYYVKNGTALDKEAELRGTSVYFPEQVIPMLPEILSNGLCSLNPAVDRLCLVCEMVISSHGDVKEFQFYEAVMRSHARLTYSKVWNILKNDRAERERYEKHVGDLEHLYALYKILKRARQQRGAIEFETTETKFIFNAERKIEHIVPVERNDAHMLIEECMISANVCAAKFILQHDAQALYRVHEKPEAERLKSFITYLAEVGVTVTKNDQVDTRSYNNLLQRVADRPDKELIQTMLLRSLKQAVYAPDNLGHFGLSLEAYAHFTSPIRRYPDLIVHRTIKHILKKRYKQKTTGSRVYQLDELSALGESCSMAERRADDATRDVADWLKCEFMLQHVGECFDGFISAVTNFGLFVRITEYQIDGLVHITSMQNDFYHFDEIKLCLTGETLGVSFRLGDAVKIKVAAVNLDSRKIDLILDDPSMHRAASGKQRRAGGKPQTPPKTSSVGRKGQDKQARSKGNKKGRKR